MSKELNLFKYFTLKRFFNAIKIVCSFYFSKSIRKPIVWGMPLSYSIEPTNLCNLKCPECPSGAGTLTRPLGVINYDFFKETIDQIYQTGFYVQLFFQGEPFINKNLSSMINYAHSKNMYVSISTNGHFINKKNAEFIVKNAPDKLIFSIDGLDEQTYQNYRVGGTFKRADEGLKILMQTKKLLKSKKPFVEFQFIVMKQNEHQLVEVRKYGREIGVDKIVFKTMQVSDYENAVRFLPQNDKYRRYTVKEGKIEIKNKIKNHCFALWRTSVITWDGKVVPCCFDKDADFEMGRLNRKSFKDIWSSDNYMNFRRGVLKNRKGMSMCTNCTEGFNMNIMEIEQ